MVFRRRSTPDPEREAARARFGEVAVALDRAQRLLLTAIPTSRNPGIPLLEALDAFERGLDDAESVMPGWRSPGVEELWQRCASALRDSRTEVARLRAAPPGPTQFELLNSRVGDVLAPLEDFNDAERILIGRRV